MAENFFKTNVKHKFTDTGSTSNSRNRRKYIKRTTPNKIAIYLKNSQRRKKDTLSSKSN